MDSTPQPLTESQVSALRLQHGPNIISTETKVTWYSILVSALFHPFNVLLVILATVTGVSDDFAGMGVMLFMVVASITIRFIQEYKSARAAAGLRTLVTHTVRVLRRSEGPPTAAAVIVVKEIPLEQLVPGDLVELKAGSLVPADVTLFESRDLLVSQSSLTGEAVPVEKYYDPGAPHRGAPQKIPTNANTNGGNGAASHSHKYGPSFNMSMGDDRDEAYHSRTPLRTQCANLLRALLGIRTERKVGQMMKADMDNPALCYMGTAVVSGTGTAVVLHTGLSTYFGSMAKQLAKAQPTNAFQLGVRRISWIFFLTMLALVPPVLLLQGFINKDWNEAFMFGIAVAVGLTPEMLPVVVSATLARGAFVMSRKKCIVKNMDSIINLGGMDVLCTDKTGTLTDNRVSLTGHIDASGQSSTLTLRLGFLNSKFQAGLSNLMDEAVTAYFQEQREKQRGALEAEFLKVDEIPFDFVRRRMTVLLYHARPSCNNEAGRFLVTKGAVDEVLAICTKLVPHNPAAPTDDVTKHFQLPDPSSCPDLTDDLRKELQALNTAYNKDGLRVIAVAFKRRPTPPAGLSDLSGGGGALTKAEETDMTFAGFLAFEDPPKQSTAAAIRRLMELNVQLKVLTGDSAAVCCKVCADIQLPVSRVVTSKELEGASEAEIEALAESGTIFAKLTPLQKADIVRALKRSDHVIGFLGDGINDAPALAEADIGISVDNGTDIARDSANMILLEKDLGVVADGVREGRLTYGNTMKYIVMAISSNFGNVFSVLVASAWLPFVPMQAIHILAQNLLYDTSQIAIPWDNMDAEFLAVPHRWSMKSVLTFMMFIGPWSSIFDITTFVFMYYYYDIKTAEDDVLLFQTAWFTVGLLTQTLIVHMIRTPRIPFIQSRAAPPLLCMTAVIMAIGVALPYIPAVSSYLEFELLGGTFYAFLAAVLLSYCIAAQLAKIAYIKIFKKWY